MLEIPILDVSGGHDVRPSLQPAQQRRQGCRAAHAAALVAEAYSDRASAHEHGIDAHGRVGSLHGAVHDEHEVADAAEGSTVGCAHFAGHEVTHPHGTRLPGCWR